MEMRRGLERSQIFLISLVSVASFFEGYDFIILSLVLPYLREGFKLSILQAGFATSLIAIGTIVAFFVVRLGDYFGRRAMLMWTVLFYTAATAATAFTNSIFGFVAMQFIARAFLVAEWGISNVIIAEELPANKRGFGMSIVNAAAGIGAVVGSALFPIVARAPLGWRTMYLIGVIPLVIVFFIRRSVKETRRFAAVRDKFEKPDFAEITRPPYRRTLVLIALLWLFMYLGYTPILTFYTDFAIHERGLSAREVALIISVAFLIGLFGYVAAGKLMDLWGRRPTSILFFIVGAASTCAAFLVPRSLMLPALVVLVFFATSYLTICSTWTAELFPTRLRASASAWTNNTLGRIGMVLAPTIVGLLATVFGRKGLPALGSAVSFMGLFPFLCAMIVLFFLPETKNRELEEIVD